MMPPRETWFAQIKTEDTKILRSGADPTRPTTGRTDNLTDDRRSYRVV